MSTMAENSFMSRGELTNKPDEETTNFELGEPDFPPPPIMTKPRLSNPKWWENPKWRIIGILVATMACLSIIVISSVVVAAKRKSGSRSQGIKGPAGGGTTGGGNPGSGASPTNTPPSGGGIGGGIGGSSPTGTTGDSPGQSPTSIHADSEMYGIITGSLDPEELNALETEGSNAYQAFLWLQTEQKIFLNPEQLLQRYSLAVFFYSTYGVSSAYTDSEYVWNVTAGWLTTDEECTWYGITCTEEEKVSAIRLRNNRLSGHIPSELQHLPFLQILDLSENSINMIGGETAVFGLLRNLLVLSVEDNYIDFIGIPLSIGDLTEIVAVEIGLNLLAGPIHPSIFENKPELVYFDANSNYLTGDIPDTVNSAPVLQQLRFQYNSMMSDLNFFRTGDIMEELRVVWLDENTVSSELPNRVGTFPQLASLSLPNTGLRSTIPKEMGNLITLTELWLENNELFGLVPDEFGLLVNLTTLELHNNSLQGSIPSGLCQNGPPAVKFTSDCREPSAKVDCLCCTCF